MTKEEPSEETGSRRIGRVAVVGCGTIGASWAALFLANGLDVVATDPAPGAEARLRSFVDCAWRDLERLGLGDRSSPSRLEFVPEIANACSDVDFVQECGPERELLKLRMFAEMDDAAAPQTLIASSSSAFRVTTMQQHCKYPERVVLGHPFNPPHLIPLVEVAGGDRTSASSVVDACAFYRGLGKTPVILRKEMDGHIANRLQAAVFREAVHILDEGVATLSDIDKAMVEGPGLRWALMGPFMTYHLAGGEGGMASFLEQLGPMQAAVWKDLGAPILDERLSRIVMDAVRREMPDPISLLIAMRDKGILSLLATRMDIANGS